MTMKTTKPQIEKNSTSFREDETHYRRLFEESPISLWEEDFSEAKTYLNQLKQDGVTDLQKYFREHPDAAAELTGLIKVLNVNKATLKIFEADSKEEMQGGLKKIVGTGFTEQIISFVEKTNIFFWTGDTRTLKGKRLHIQLHISVLPGFEESLGRAIVSIIDITSLKQAQEEITHLSSFPLLNPNAVLEFDLNGKVNFCNAAVWSILAEQNLEDPQVFLQEPLETLKDIEKSDSKFLNREIAIGRLIFTETIQLISSLNVIRVYATDITDRKLAEKALMESEEKFRSIIEQAHEGMALTDEQGSIIEWNRALEEMTGISQVEARGKSLWDLQKSLSPEGRITDIQTEQTRSLILNALKHGGEILSKGFAEVEIETRKGERKFISQMVFPVKTEKGHRLVSLIRDLTEKKMAEDEAHRSNERYQSIAEDMPLMICRFKHDGTLTYVNTYYCQYYKASEDQLIGKNLFSMVPESEQEFVRNNYLSLTPEKPFTTYEFKVSDMEDGIERWQKWTDRALFDKNGEVIEFQSLGEDVTERKHAEQMLRESEARFRSLIANAGDMIVVINAEGVISFASPSFEKSLGITPQDALGKNFMEWVHPDDLPEVKIALESRIKTPGTAAERIKVRGRHNDGSWRYLDALGTTLLDDPSINGIVLNIRDVTENEKAENALRQSEERFSKAFQSSPTGTAITHIKDGLIIDVNNAFLNMFGYERAEAIGKTTLELNLFYDHEDREELTKILRGKGVVPTRELKLQKKSGELITTLISIESIKINNEDCALTSVTDITQRKSMEDALRQSEFNLNHAQAVSHTGSWSRDLVNNVLTWSEESYRIFGVPIGAPISYEMYLGLIHPEDYDYLAPKWEETLKKKISTSYTIEYRLIVNNEIKWVSEEIEVQFDANGIPTAVFGIIQDITKQRRIEQEKQALAEIVQGLAFSKDLTEFLGRMHQSIDRVVQARNLFVTLYNESTGLFEDVYSVDQYDGPLPPSTREGTLTRHVFTTSQPMLITHEKFDELISTGQAKLVGTNFQSWLGVPLKTADKTIGVIVIQDYETPNLYSDKDLEFLASISGQVALAVERKRAEAENVRQLSELETLYESGLAFGSANTPKEIAQKAVAILERKMNWHHIAIRQYHAETDSVSLIAFNRPGLKASEAEEEIRNIGNIISNPNQGLSGWVAKNKKPIRVPNVKADPRYTETFPGIQSGLYVPLLYDENVIGSVAVESETENVFTEQDERLLITLAGQAAVSIENATLYEMAQKEIIERKQAESALQKQTQELAQLNNQLESRVSERTAEIEITRQRLELATKAAGLGIWEWNINSGKLFWDAQMHKIYHVAPETFHETMTEFVNMVHEDDLTKLMTIIQNVTEGQHPYTVEYRVIRPDQSICHVITHGLLLKDKDGKPERIIGITEDITSQKQAEQTLRESEAYARLLFDAAPDPVSVAEVDGTMIEVNKAFEQLHHLKHEEIRGRHISALNIFPAEEVEKSEEYVAAIMQGKTMPPVELDFHTANDGIHVLEMHSYPIQVNGRPLVLSTSRDITVHKKAKDVLHIANIEMERALHMKDEFLANMSHELRTPLNAILGISESLEEQIIGNLNEKQLKYLRTINESGRHLLELINDILDLSKIEAGRLDLNVADVDPNHLCNSSLRMVKELAQKKDLRISLSMDAQVTSIRGDERRLKQAVVNLLSNAVKFTPQGGQIGLELKGIPQDSVVQIIVSDNGIGIAEGKLDRLFKPFVQLDSSLSREYPGTGLGLALVAQMIRLHGGGVGVNSELGKGSRFVISLPWVQNEQAASAERTPTEPRAKSQSDGKRKGKILIVEDTESISFLLKDYISHLGYEVILAQDGINGVEQAIKEQPDLIIMDVMMPGIDGLEATKRIRTIKNLQQIPIIALTALAMTGDRERCLEAGMTDYMSKPIQMQKLAKMLTLHLNPLQDVR